MRIIFVMGPSLSGKTTYIINQYPHSTVVNFSYFCKFAYAAQTNEELEQIVENAQLFCIEELQERLANAVGDEVFILEHSMLHRQERESYIRVVREATDTPIEAVVMDPDEETLRIMLKGEKQLLALYEFEKKMMEPVSLEEGFSSITPITNTIA